MITHVLLADDHTETAELLRGLLSRSSGDREWDGLALVSAAERFIARRDCRDISCLTRRDLAATAILRRTRTPGLSVTSIAIRSWWRGFAPARWDMWQRARRDELVPGQPARRPRQPVPPRPILTRNP
jgi:hypothetical protein